jgi:hypothetical protein
MPEEGIGPSPSSTVVIQLLDSDQSPIGIIDVLVLQQGSSLSFKGENAQLDKIVSGGQALYYLTPEGFKPARFLEITWAE